MEEVILKYDQRAYSIGLEYHNLQPNINYYLKYKHILKQDQILVVVINDIVEYVKFYPDNTVLLKINKKPIRQMNITNLSKFILNLHKHELTGFTKNNVDYVTIGFILSTLIAISDGYLNIYSEPINRKEKRNIEKTINIKTNIIYKICIIKNNIFKNIHNIPTHIKQKEHTRRGHYRHYKNGKVIFIHSYTAGNKALGTIKKDYKIGKYQP
jgi:hypothetical protein